MKYLPIIQTPPVTDQLLQYCGLRIMTHQAMHNKYTVINNVMFSDSCKRQSYKYIDINTQATLTFWLRNWCQQCVPEFRARFWKDLKEVVLSMHWDAFKPYFPIHLPFNWVVPEKIHTPRRKFAMSGAPPNLLRIIRFNQFKNVFF